MIEPLWTSAQALAATRGTGAGDDWSAFDIAIDSREVRTGDLFVALKGERTDGHRYVADAVTAGAVAAVIEHPVPGLDAATPTLTVEDSLGALRDLGAAARDRSKATRIAVTGSVGKTGTKEALRAALDRQSACHASARSFNNHIGVPLTLARMPPAADYAVFEMGMNHPGEIAPLAELVRPHIALVTTVQPVHTAFFDSLDAIADAKAEVFTGLAPEGVAVLNRDIPQYGRLADAAAANGAGRIISFGEDAAADVRLLGYRLKATCSCVTADVAGQMMMYKINLPGRHWVWNSLGVLAAVHAAGGDLCLAGVELAAMTPLGGRGQRREIAWPGGSVTVIDESYNASPAAVEAALNVLAGTVPGRRGRRIAVLGDMLELGDDSRAFHQRLAEPLRASGADLVFTVGSEAAALRDVLPAALIGGQSATADGIIAPLRRSLTAGDVVLVKGSNSVGLGAVVSALEAAYADTPEGPGRAADAV